MRPLHWVLLFGFALQASAWSPPATDELPAHSPCDEASGRCEAYGASGVSGTGTCTQKAGCIHRLWKWCSKRCGVEDLGADLLQSRQLMGVGMAFLAGLSTTLGALIVFLLPGNHVGPELSAFVFALAASVMVTMTVLEFWLPLLLEGSWEDVRRVIAFSCLGVLAFVLLSLCVPEPDITGGAHDAQVHNGVHKANGPSDRTPAKRWHVALILMLTLTAHNLPEGFAVAISALESDRLGYVVMLAIAMHNVPEGIAIAVPVLEATNSRWQAMWMTFLAGMAEPVGALFAVFFLGQTAPSEQAMSDLFSAVGGVMVAVAFKELYPEASRQARPWYFSAGSLAGFLVMHMTLEMGV